MTTWEYHFIPLDRLQQKYVDSLAAQVNQAGMDGWEAVGQITITHYGSSPSQQLLLKRAKPL
jgi:hypothetical protein